MISGEVCGGSRKLVFLYVTLREDWKICSPQKISAAKSTNIECMQITITLYLCTVCGNTVTKASKKQLVTFLPVTQQL